MTINLGARDIDLAGPPPLPDLVLPDLVPQIVELGRRRASVARGISWVDVTPEPERGTHG
ncbi:MAG TPA: hypothetical protein VNZ66_11430 [Aeromicrobium sp.]|nr:hypothetical protein [Aeromicrobium sp.]